MKCWQSSSVQRSLRFVALAAFATFLVTGCGGGGDAGTASPAPSAGTSDPAPAPTPPTPPAPTPPTPPAPPPAFTVTFSPASVTLNSNTTGANDLQWVSFTLANVPNNANFYGARWQGSAIKDASSSMTSANEGNVTFHMVRPTALGAGTYTDRIEIRFCEDAACDRPVSASGAELPVTFVVTGDPLPSTTYSFMPDNNLRLRVQTVDTVSKHLHVLLGVVDMPPSGVYVRFIQNAPAGSPTLLESRTYTQTGSGLDLDFTFKPGSSFEPGVYTQDLIAQVCFDSACVREVRTGPLSLPLELDVRASEGKEFLSRRLDAGAQDVAWDSVSGRLYILRVTATGNALVEIDPLTGASLRSVSITPEPDRLRLSDDGQFAYIASQDFGPLQRYRLADLSHDLDVPLPGFSVVRQLAVAPGAPGTIAVLLDDPGQPLRVSIYDGATVRPQGYVSAYPIYVANEMNIVWGADASRLHLSQYQTPGVIDFDVSAAGLAQIGFTSIPGFVPPIQGDGGKIVGGKGIVFDTATKTTQTTQAPGCCGERLQAVDANLGNLFRQINDGIERVDLDGSGRLAIATLPATSTGNGTLVRWGDAGLALVTYDGKLVILEGSFVKH